MQRGDVLTFLPENLNPKCPKGRRQVLMHKNMKIIMFRDVDSVFTRRSGARATGGSCGIPRSVHFLDCRALTVFAQSIPEVKQPGEKPTKLEASRSKAKIEIGIRGIFKCYTFADQHRNS